MGVGDEISSARGFPSVNGRIMRFEFEACAYEFVIFGDWVHFVSYRLSGSAPSVFLYKTYQLN